MSEHPAIDRTIYPMPMFATFQVRDIAATTAFYGGTPNPASNNANGNTTSTT